MITDLIAFLIVTVIVAFCSKTEKQETETVGELDDEASKRSVKVTKPITNKPDGKLQNTKTKKMFQPKITQTNKPNTKAVETKKGKKVNSAENVSLKTAKDVKGKTLFDVEISKYLCRTQESNENIVRPHETPKKAKPALDSSVSIVKCEKEDSARTRTDEVLKFTKSIKRKRLSKDQSTQSTDTRTKSAKSVKSTKM